MTRSRAGQRTPGGGWAQRGTRIAARVAALTVVAGLILLATRPSTPSSPSGAPSESPAASILLGGKPATNRGTFDVFTAKEPEAEIETELFAYAPTLIIAPAREKVMIELGNESKARHTITSRALRLDREVGPYGFDVFLLETPRPGTYVFFCRYHAAQGMRGAFEIRPRS